MIAKAEAKGQSRFFSNSLTSCRPIIRLSAHRAVRHDVFADRRDEDEQAPGQNAGMESGKVTRQKASSLVQPRSCAASRSVSSIFSSVA